MVEIRIGRPKKKKEEMVADTDIINAEVGGGAHALTSQEESGDNPPMIIPQDLVRESTPPTLQPPEPPKPEVKIDPRLKYFAENYGNQFQELPTSLLYAIYCEQYQTNELLHHILKKG